MFGLKLPLTKLGAALRRCYTELSPLVRWEPGSKHLVVPKESESYVCQKLYAYGFYEDANGKFDATQLPKDVTQASLAKECERDSLNKPQKKNAAVQVDVSSGPAASQSQQKASQQASTKVTSLAVPAAGAAMSKIKSAGRGKQKAPEKNLCSFSA